MSDAVALSPPPVRVRRQTPSGTVAMVLGVGLLIAVVSMPWWATAGTYPRRRGALLLHRGRADVEPAGGLRRPRLGRPADLHRRRRLHDVRPWRSFGGSIPSSRWFCAWWLRRSLAVPTYALLHRLDGPYFAIGTWVVAEVFRLATSVFPYVNSGAGMSLRVMTDYSAYERAVGISLLCALLLLVTIGGSYWLLRSRYGLALTAIRDNPVAAASQGVNVGRLRFLIWIAAAVGTGFAGRDLLHGAAAHHAALGLRPELGQHRDLHRHGRRARLHRRAC